MCNRLLNTGLFGCTRGFYLFRSASRGGTDEATSRWLFAMFAALASELLLVRARTRARTRRLRLLCCSSRIRMQLLRGSEPRDWKYARRKSILDYSLCRRRRRGYLLGVAVEFDSARFGLSLRCRFFRAVTAIRVNCAASEWRHQRSRSSFRGFRHFSRNNSLSPVIRIEDHSESNETDFITQDWEKISYSNLIF